MTLVRGWSRTATSMLAVAALVLACTSEEVDPERYRLAGSGTHWDVSGSDRVLDDLWPRYPAFFEHLSDPARPGELDLLALRDDLERAPTDRRNYDALNALAMGYFEITHRADSRRGEYEHLTLSFQAAKLLAVPWRAYSEIGDPALREAIVDFFEDAASGEKLGSARAATRLNGILHSLEEKETEPLRRERLARLARRMDEQLAELEAAARAAPPQPAGSDDR